MNKQAGFTIVELLMVILLVGVLSAVMMPQFIDFRTDAKIAVTKDKLSSIKLALLGDARQVVNGVPVSPGYIKNMGSLPSSLTDLVTKGSQATYDPFSKRGWNGPYLDSTNANWNKDGWDINFVYSSTGRTVTSCGPNKICGNADDIVINF